MAGCCDCAASEQELSDRRFRRVLWIALVANATMFLVEAVASAIGDSMSLQADAMDFLGDSANYAISLFVTGAALSTRAKASLVKGATMAAFGIWVLGSAIYRALLGSEPDPAVMSGVAVVALSVNVAVAVMLFGFRDGDSNRTSIWLCSRNDAIANVAVIAAAGGVFASGSRWPDLAVAAGIAALNLSAALQVARLARRELRLAAAATPNAAASPNTAAGAPLSSRLMRGRRRRGRAAPGGGPVAGQPGSHPGQA